MSKETSSNYSMAPIDPAYEDSGSRVEMLRIVLGSLFMILGSGYLSWRVFSSNPDIPIISWMFFGAEILGFTELAIVFMISFKRYRRLPVIDPHIATVDVFIPTYNEPIEIVRRSLVAAKRICYPHETWLLDDGHRPAFREMAEELGCHYIARDKNTGAKAGNINNALQYAKGEFIAFFDADHCAQQDFVHRVIGYFKNPNVAYVQTPQDFYNYGSFEYPHDKFSTDIWHEESLFKHVLQPGRDTFSAATLCGCSCIIRRAHMDMIGGFPSETVTEDMHLAVRLQKMGLETIYHDEPLAFGIAAPGFPEYVTQRLRWGQGNMQVCLRERLPFTSRLTWRQNLSYVLLGLPYFDSWRRLFLYFYRALHAYNRNAPGLWRPGKFHSLFCAVFSSSRCWLSKSFTRDFHGCCGRKSTKWRD